MRICILSQYYPPEIGAPQARLSALARRFVQQGHEVHVLTAMPNYPKGRIYPGYGGIVQRETLDGVHVLRTCIYPTKSVKMVRRLSSYFSFVCSSVVAGVALLPDIDYLVTESPPIFLGITGYLLSRFKRAKWIFNVSDLWPESAVRLGAVGQGHALRMVYALEAFCYRKAWLVTGQSREILESVQRRFLEVPTYHLPNGVNTDVFTPARRHGQLHQRLVGDGTCLAIYAGLHGIAQGLDQVLEAAAQVQDIEGLRFAFIGDGPEKQNLIGLSRKLRLRNVRFEEPVPAVEVPALLASADIAMVPLKAHLPGAVPSKLYEAMASGRPVLLAASGEAATIVDDSGAGRTIGPGDSKAMAAALRELYGDAQRREEMGLNGRRAAVAQFDQRAVADRFIHHLAEEFAC